jgi:hypothetical protein
MCNIPLNLYYSGNQSVWNIFYVKNTKTLIMKISEVKSDKHWYKNYE